MDANVSEITKIYIFREVSKQLYITRGPIMILIHLVL